MSSQPAPGDRGSLPAPWLGQILHGHLSMGTGCLEGPGRNSSWPGPRGRQWPSLSQPSPRGRPRRCCPLGLAHHVGDPSNPKRPGCLRRTRPAEPGARRGDRCSRPRSKPGSPTTCGTSSSSTPKATSTSWCGSRSCREGGRGPRPEAGEGPGREGATLPHRALSCPQHPAPGDLPGTGPTLHLPTLSPGLGTLTVGSGTPWLRVQAQRARSCGSSTIRGVAGLRAAVTPRGLSPEPGSVRHRVPGLTDPAPGCEAHQLRGLAPPRGARSWACLSQHVRGARLGHLQSSLETLGGSGVPPCPG